MRTRHVILLMILAVPLMGSECHVAARVGGPPPPPDDVDPPPSGRGGGVIIVTSTDPVVSGATLETRLLEPTLVASALAVSVWTPSEREPVAASSVLSVSAMREPAELGFEFGQTELIGSEASFAVPEPTGALLFGCGLWIVSSRTRARARAFREESR